jgi:hypothetical protein
VEARFSAPVQADPGAHPASCTMGPRSFLGVESGQGVMLTPHPLLVPRSKNRVELYLFSPLGPLWPVERVKPTYIIIFKRCNCNLPERNSDREFCIDNVNISIFIPEKVIFLSEYELVLRF